MEFPQVLPAHLQRYACGYWENRTLGDHARAWADSDGDTVVFLGDPAEPTYSSLLGDGEALARALIDLGLRPGDVIGFQTPNWSEAAVINLAAALGGFVIAPIVHIYRDAEVRQMLGDCGAKAFFVAESFRSIDYAAMVARIRADLPDLAHVIYVRPQHSTPSFAELVAHGRGLGQALPQVDPDHVKLLLYTSGTTGRPKAVLHSHNTLARVARVTAAHARIVGQDVALMPSPVTHISGYSGGLEKPFQIGSRTVLMEVWDAVRAVELIERYQVTSTVAATPFLMELCRAAQEAGRTLPSFQRFACGGAAVPADLVRAANAALANACAYRVYGSSEVPLATQGYMPDTDPDLAAESDGQPLDYDLSIIDDDGHPLAAGLDGEVLARGPAMFMGYADPAQTAAAITGDGYFRTGDIGHLTAAGALVITGRKKDLIIRGGENISAKEIEDVLQTHAAVREAAVVAMPHARLGEGICAYIVLSAAASADDLAAHVQAAGLARQKCPERFEFAAELPRTASGKVRKDLLREDIRAKV